MGKRLETRPDLVKEGFISPPVTTPHALRSLGLPPLHHDPFDRMLITQALEEDLIFITKDGQILTYQMKLLEARPMPVSSAILRLLAYCLP